MGSSASKAASSGGKQVLKYGAVARSQVEKGGQVTRVGLDRDDIEGASTNVRELEVKGRKVLNEALKDNLNPHQGLTAREVLALTNEPDNPQLAPRRKLPLLYRSYVCIQLNGILIVNSILFHLYDSIVSVHDVQMKDENFVKAAQDVMKVIEEENLVKMKKMDVQPLVSFHFPMFLYYIYQCVLSCVF